MGSLKRIVLPIGFALVCLVLLVVALTAEVDAEMLALGEGDSADIILSFAEPSARTFEDRQLALAATQAQIIYDANIAPSAIIRAISNPLRTPPSAKISASGPKA